MTCRRTINQKGNTMRLTDAQAKALGITDAQIREARLTPTAARYVTQDHKPRRYAIPHDGAAFEVMEWLRAELEARFPGEIRETQLGLEFPRVKLRIEIDAWSGWSKRYAGMTDEYADWAVLGLTADALRSKTRQLDLMQIITAYAEAEERYLRGEKQ